MQNIQNILTSCCLHTARQSSDSTGFQVFTYLLFIGRQVVGSSSLFCKLCQNEQGRTSSNRTHPFCIHRTPRNKQVITSAIKVEPLINIFSYNLGILFILSTLAGWDLFTHCHWHLSILPYNHLTGMCFPEGWINDERMAILCFDSECIGLNILSDLKIYVVGDVQRNTSLLLAVHGYKDPWKWSNLKNSNPIKIMN